MKTDAERLNVLLLILGILLGAYARFLPTLIVGFPVTDGGLFYAMVKALQANHYVLPAFVEYNDISIPFAYPPLGFYIAGLLSDLFHMPLIEVFRWMPVVGSVAFTIAFFPMATSILKSRLKGSLATIFFALLPRSISWYIMGGGITRVMGNLFLILILFSVYKLFTEPSKKYLAMTILFGSGVVLSHPEAALYAVSLCIVFWMFFGRSREGIKNALLTALGVIILTTPFFAIVISRHGLQPYLSAAQTGLQSPLAWVAILAGSFADEKFVTLISALALLGFVVTLIKREFLLVILLFLPAIIDPRGAASISIIAWAMLAAVGFVEVVIPGLYTLNNTLQKSQDAEGDWNAYFTDGPAVKIVIIALIFYVFSGTVLSDQVYLKLSLTPSDRNTMNWIANNLPQRSRFVILTGETEAFADAVSEWFPVLSKSSSIATIQGYEWLPGKLFQTKLDQYYALQLCINKNYTCVQEWGLETHQDYDYILVSQGSLSTGKNPLVESLMISTDYQLVYQKDDIAVFKKIF